MARHRLEFTDEEIAALSPRARAAIAEILANRPAREPAVTPAAPLRFTADNEAAKAAKQYRPDGTLAEASFVDLHPRLRP